MCALKNRSDCTETPKSISEMAMVLQALTNEIIATSKIEGKVLERSLVLSAVARRLGIDLGFILDKSQYWETLAGIPLNERQRKIINRLLDGFDGKLTTSKWAKINKCSQDTAYRDILELIDRGILSKNPEGGRSTSYALVPRKKLAR